MITAILAALKDEVSASSAKEIIWAIYCSLHLLSTDYVKDGDLRDAAIDAITTFLQQQKGVSVPISSSIATPLCAPSVQVSKV
jgi:hypothetical protein